MISEAVWSDSRTTSVLGKNSRAVKTASLIREGGREGEREREERKGEKERGRKRDGERDREGEKETQTDKDTSRKVGGPLIYHAIVTEVQLHESRRTRQCGCKRTYP